MAEEPEQQDSPEAEGGEEAEKESGDEHEEDEEEEPKPEIVVGSAGTWLAPVALHRLLQVVGIGRDFDQQGAWLCRCALRRTMPASPP